MTPLVTVLIYYAKDRGWLNEAINSVHNQKYNGQIQLLTSESVEGHEDMNASQNLNALIKKAEGGFIKYLSEDDRLTPDCISESVKAFSDNIDFIHGNAINFNHRTGKKKTYVPKIKYPSLLDLLRTDWHIHGGTLMYRKTVFDVVGLFDESLTCAEELDFNLRCKKAGLKIGYTNKTLYEYRIHDNQKSLGKSANQAERNKIKNIVRDRYR